MEVPRPGIESAPATYAQLQQHWILNPWCQTRDQTSKATEKSLIINPTVLQLEPEKKKKKLTKEQHSGNYKTLLKEIKDRNRGKTFHIHGLENLLR